MDTILRGNDNFNAIEHAVLPPAEFKMTLRQRFKRLALRVESFIEVYVCCGSSSLVEDWDFDQEVRHVVRATADDDIDFSDLVEQYNAATSVDAHVSEWEEEEHLGEVLSDMVCGAAKVESGEAAPELVTYTADVAYAKQVAKLRCGIKTRRRRKRVVSFVVVALINKVRCKYYHMDNSPANRRLVGSYLLKLMREHNFRTCDIHLHVQYAVDLYFDLLGSDMKPSVYARG